MLKRVGTMLAAAMVSAALIAPSSAFAVSLPYVDDVNDYGEGHVICTVIARGEGKLKLKAKCNGESLEVVRHHRGVWTVVIPTHESVKLIAKDANGKRAIRYEVC